METGVKNVFSLYLGRVSRQNCEINLNCTKHWKYSRL